jgi:hypothetical protein
MVIRRLSFFAKTIHPIISDKDIAQKRLLAELVMVAKPEH